MSAEWSVEVNWLPATARHITGRTEVYLHREGHEQKLLRTFDAVPKALRWAESFIAKRGYGIYMPDYERAVDGEVTSLFLYPEPINQEAMP